MECCLALMICMLVVTGTGGGLGESSDSLANTWEASGMELLLPYLELTLLRTELLTDCSSESESGPFSDLGTWSEVRELGSEDFRDRLEDIDGDLDWTRLDLLPLRSICSTLEKISLLQSDPMLRLLASIDSLVLGSAARADSKLPFHENLSSSKCSATPPLLAEFCTSSSWPRGREPRLASPSLYMPCQTSYSLLVDLAIPIFKLLSSREALLRPISSTSTDFDVFFVNLNGLDLGEVPKFGPINTFGESNELKV